MTRIPLTALPPLLSGGAGLAGYALLGWTGAAIGGTLAFVVARYGVQRGNGILLAWLGARPLPESLAARRVTDLVGEWSGRLGIAPPALRVTEGEQVNAFALSAPDGTSICVTEGFLDALDEGEAEALLVLQLERIRSGTAERTSRGALIGTFLARLASPGLTAKADRDPNPLAVPPATVMAPLAAAAVRLLASAEEERAAERTTARRLGGPERLVRALERAEFTAYARPLDVPAALGVTGVVPTHPGVPSSALARLYHRPVPVAERAAALRRHGADPPGARGRLPTAA